MELLSALCQGAPTVEDSTMIDLVVKHGMVECCVSVMRANKQDAKLTSVATTALLNLTVSARSVVTCTAPSPPPHSLCSVWRTCHVS